MQEATNLEEEFTGQWLASPNIDQLHQMASGWKKDSVLLPTWDQNRKFLSVFGMHLMNQFWFEEKQLERAKALDRHAHTREHHHLARVMQGLMEDLNHRLDRTRQIHEFLKMWNQHHEMTAQPKLTPAVLD